MTENTVGKKIRKKEEIEAPFFEQEIDNNSNSEDLFV